MIQVLESVEAVSERAADWIASGIRRIAQAKPRCALALAGGRTPRNAYLRLSQLTGIPWSQVEIFFTDERAVRPDSPDSNYRMAREALLRQVPIPDGSVHRMEAERHDLAVVAREYEARLPASLDLLLLGIGADGHTASLFPNAPALTERERLVVPVVGGVPLIQRLTITPPVIARAGGLLVIAVGAEKAEVVARALEGPVDVATVPAQLAREGDWIIDRAAGMLLR